ncbi:MAG: hypothetical protein JWM79_1117 [Nocardioides sp.]|jgi:hypothetical protein|nr:hypothetical protein [Nocardioides sp.]
MLALVALLTGACSQESAAPKPAPSPSALTAAPSYDALAEPSSAVLPLVPEAAVSLTVTDFDTVRLQLGSSELTSKSPRTERDAFWQRAETETALLTRGMLRPVEAKLAADYGFTQDDVDWEAHFFDASGAEIGWVLSIRLIVDMGAVQRAVDDGVGPLADGAVVAGEHLVVHGTAAAGQASWATDPVWSSLVGSAASSTYAARGCVPVDSAPVELEPLDAYSVAFQGTLATARLGVGRTDLFARLGLGDGLPTFATGFTGGVADPTTGRIGYEMVDPPAAADLALRGSLPFAACAPS